LIPKIIHYCWFGKARKPKLILDCIASWNAILPDYEIIEWNESNISLLHPFVKVAYSNKEWAFVSDYIRLEKLYEYGGIYLDTDMLILKSIDRFLENECFFGAENSDLISAGIIGAIPNNNFIREVLLHYDSIQFNVKKKVDFTIPSILTKVFTKINNYGSGFNNLVEFDKVKVYPVEYFYPVCYHDRRDIINYKNYITENSYAVHLWNSSWIEQSEFDYLRQRKYKRGFRKVFKNLSKKENVNYKYFRKILSCIKESLNETQTINHHNML
jgi:mannosyltransferase OCH1-like enzyme